MCHVNLDMKQADIERRYGVRHDMLVYYLSDLVGLALGLDEQALGIDRHFVVEAVGQPWPESASSPAGAARTSPATSTCERVAAAGRPSCPACAARVAYKYMCSDPGQIADPREDRRPSGSTASSSPPARRTCT